MQCGRVCRKEDKQLFATSAENNCVAVLRQTEAVSGIGQKQSGLNL